MNNAVIMQIGNSFNDLGKQYFHLVFINYSWTWFVSDMLVKVTAIDILNYYGYFVTAIDCIVELHDAWMFKLAHNINFFLKSMDKVDVFWKLHFVVLFNSHLFIRIDIMCSIHNTKSTLTKEDIDFIVF
jgi:hypothetical protein